MTAMSGTNVDDVWTQILPTKGHRHESSLAWVELLASSVVLVASVAVNALAWLALSRVLNIHHRLVDVESQIRSCELLADSSGVRESALRAVSVGVKIDLRQNKVEKTTAVARLNNPSCPYSYSCRPLDVPGPGKATKIPTENKLQKPKEQPPKISSKEKSKEKPDENENKNQSQSEPESKEEGPSPVQKKKGSKERFEKPTDQKVQVPKKDPNYETLMGLDNKQVFGVDRKQSKFKAPAKVEKVEDKDPQYETLVGLGEEVFNDQNDKKTEAKN